MGTPTTGRRRGLILDADRGKAVIERRFSLPRRNEDEEVRPPPGQEQPAEEHSLDKLARSLADGSISRRQALRWMGGAIAGVVLASVPGVALAPAAQAATFCFPRFCGRKPNCFCAQNAAGGNACVCDISCATARPCMTAAECNANEVCSPNTGCGPQGICEPLCQTSTSCPPLTTAGQGAASGRTSRGRIVRRH